MKNPRHRNKALTLDVEQRVAKAVLDGGKTLEAAAKAEGFGSMQVAKIAVAREQGRREVLSDLPVDPGTLSEPMRKRFDAALRQHKKRLDQEYDIRVQQGVAKWRDEHGIPSYFKKLDEVEKLLKWRNGVMSKADYNSIMRCLHPDGLRSRTEEQMAEAFRLFTHHKIRLVNEEEERKKTFQGIEIPRTMEELLARKAQFEAARRAKRAAGK